MKESSRNLLVGLFVVLAFGALGVLMVWFGEAPDWLRTNEWTLRIVDVKNLRGVGPGSPVKLNGVEIGRVAGIDFRNRERPDQGVEINARIKSVYEVPRGAYAKVYGATLGIGSGQVDIVMEPGADLTPIDQDDAVITGRMSSMIGEIINKEMVNSVQRTVESIGRFMDSADPVAQNLAAVLEERKLADVDRPGGPQPNLSTLIERVDRFMANLDEVIGDDQVQEDVKGSMRELKAATEEVRQLLAMWGDETKRLADNANDGIDMTERKIGAFFQQLMAVLGHLNETSQDLARIARGIQQGKGTAGLLARDDRLYESAVLTLQRLDRVLANMEHITGKVVEDGYITIGQETAVGTFTKDFPTPGGPAPKTPARAQD